MNTPNNGGSAFPLPPSTMITYANGDRELEIATPGMTLRDYFAAAALQGLMASTSEGYSYRDRATDAYILADAMLAERAKTTGDKP